MDALALARWQFAITTVYHFLFVPVTIGMSALVAYYHVRWVRHRDPADLRITKFLGKLFTINFAMLTGFVMTGSDVLEIKSCTFTYETSNSEGVSLF